MSYWSKLANMLPINVPVPHVPIRNWKDGPTRQIHWCCPPQPGPCRHHRNCIIVKHCRPRPECHRTVCIQALEVFRHGHCPSISFRVPLASCLPRPWAISTPVLQPPSVTFIRPTYPPARCPAVLKADPTAIVRRIGLRIPPTTKTKTSKFD